MRWPAQSSARHRNEKKLEKLKTKYQNTYSFTVVVVVKSAALMTAVMSAVSVGPCAAIFTAALNLRRFVALFSGRELAFTFAICYRPSVCRLSVGRLSVTLVHPTQAVEIFGHFFQHTIAQGL